MGTLSVNLKVNNVLYTAEDNYTNNNIVYRVEVYNQDDGGTHNLDYSHPVVLEHDYTIAYRIYILSLTNYADYTNYSDNEMRYSDGYVDVDEDETITLELKSKYPIIYDANGGTSAPPQQWKLFDMPTRLYPRASGYVPVRDGYYLKEWNTQSDGNGVSYLPSELYLDNSSITLYAQWVPSDRIYIVEQGFVNVAPYIYTDGQWKLAVKHVYSTNNGW